MKKKILVTVASVLLVILLAAFTYYLLSTFVKRPSNKTISTPELTEVKSFDEIAKQYGRLSTKLPAYSPLAGSYSTLSSYSYTPQGATYSVTVNLPFVGGFEHKNKQSEDLTDVTKITTELLVSKGFKETNYPGRSAKLFDSKNVICLVGSAAKTKENAAYSALYCSQKNERGVLETESKEVKKLIELIKDSPSPLDNSPTISRYTVTENEKKFTTLMFVYSGKLPSRAYFASVNDKTYYLGSALHSSYDNDTPSELPVGVLKAANDTALYGDFIKRQFRL
ncbi:hypothetical protein IPM09_02705 [Candidatus Saccharibacteria bacterium]|nr:MAG: hypothetical protein IPM09_02705 [Candidatus Saccharibacteria bacterium]